MTNWTPVQPLSDEPQDQTYWEPQQFKIGDHVRVRLSGECQVRGLWVVGRAGKALGIEDGIHLGHPDHTDGLSGQIIKTSQTYEGHPYRVRLKCAAEPCSRGVHLGFFAACELEPLL